MTHLVTIIFALLLFIFLIINGRAVFAVTIIGGLAYWLKGLLELMPEIGIEYTLGVYLIGGSAFVGVFFIATMLDRKYEPIPIRHDNEEYLSSHYKL